MIVPRLTISLVSLRCVSPYRFSRQPPIPRALIPSQVPPETVSDGNRYSMPCGDVAWRVAPSGRALNSSRFMVTIVFCALLCRVNVHMQRIPGVGQKSLTLVCDDCYNARLKTPPLRPGSAQHAVPLIVVYQRLHGVIAARLS